MPLDPILLADTRDWLNGARRDLRAGEHDLTAEPPLLEDVLFHTQQAAEKSMKGFLMWHDIPFRKTHNLIELGQQCQIADATLRQTVERAATLSEYAWRYRYPGERTNPGLDEALSALELARSVYDEVLARLPPEVRL